MIVINDDTRDSQVQNKKKDTQQDIEIASLQAAVESINTQITAINSSVSALSNTIDDKYSAQTQALMSALTNQINALSESLSALISTNQINADYGNFETLAATVSATIESLAAVVLNVSDKATIREAEVTSLEAENETVTRLTATEATLQRAVINSLSIVSTFNMRTLSAETATIYGLNSIEIKASQKADAPKIIADVVTGRTWQTPIGTPDNTELLKITVPHYEGIIQLITEDREFNVSIFNNSLFTWTEQSGYLFRIQRNDENTEIYLENIGDTVNYQLLFIGSKNIVTATSEIVDKTGIRQNVNALNGVYGAGSGEGGSGSQIIFVEELPSAGEEGIIYLSETLGAWVWNEDDGELVPLTGTNLQEAVQTNTENIGDLSDLTTTADSDLVSAINELDSDTGDLTSLTTTAKTSLVAAINEVDSNTDTNTGAIATINGNDAGLSMRQVAQDVTSNVYIPCGSVAFANLPVLSGARIGDVYNVTDSFTTTSDFIEGAGHVIPAGSNVAVIDYNNVKKWDVLGSMVDLSAYYTKVQTNTLLDEKTDLTVIAQAYTPGVYKGGDYVIHEGALYKCKIDHTTAQWEPANWDLVTVGERVKYLTDTKTDLTIVAPAFSDTTSYAVGDFVIYNGKLYQCTAAHSSGAWNSSHFTEKKLADLASGTALYLAKNNPSGTGTFSMNRRAGQPIGSNSSTLGYNCIADGDEAHAEGNYTRAAGQGAHAEGMNSAAYGRANHAEGEYTRAEGNYGTHAEGERTIAYGGQHVQGRYNALDNSTTPVYADIVGNGTADNDRKNIEATTWTGDKRLKGTVYVGCNDDSTGGDCLARENMIAPAFSDTISYAVGDFVIYNNVLYKCTTAHTAGTWVAGHFTQATVGGTLGEIVPSNASVSNKLVTENDLGYAKFPTIMISNTQAVKITRNILSVGTGKFIDVFGTMYMLSVGDQGNRFYLTRVVQGVNSDVITFARSTSSVYIYPNTFHLYFLELLGNLSYAVIAKSDIPEDAEIVTI